MAICTFFSFYAKMLSFNTRTRSKKYKMRYINPHPCGFSSRACVRCLDGAGPPQRVNRGAVICFPDLPTHAQNNARETAPVAPNHATTMIWYDIDIFFNYNGAKLLLNTHVRIFVPRSLPYCCWDPKCLHEVYQPYYTSI